MSNQEHNQKVEEDILFIPLLIALLILSIGWVSLFAGFFTVGGASVDPTLQFGSWVNYQDNDYGMGIAYIEVWDNSTKTAFALQENITNTESGCQVNGSCSVQLIIGYVANRTHLGFDRDNLALGGNFIKFNVTVTLRNGTQVFTQQNGTYVLVYHLEKDLFVYEYSMILNFVTEYYAIYDVVINYDSYYGGGFTKNYVYWNDMANTSWVTWDDCDIASDGDLFAWNKTADTLATVKDDNPSINLTQTVIEVYISQLSPGTSFNLMIRNSTDDNNNVWTLSTLGYHKINLYDMPKPHNLDVIKRLYYRASGGSGANKTVQLDYLNIFIYEKTVYGSRNDMGSTAFVDTASYCSVSTTGSIVKITDDEAGHAWASAQDLFNTVEISEVNLRFFPHLLVKTLDGYDPNWVSWGVRLWWANGTNYLVIDQNTTWGATVLNVLDFCDSENTTIIGFDMVVWGVDNQGNEGSFDWLHFYAPNAPTWYTQDVEIVLTGQAFLGMLMSGISLIGLCMIPLGTITGALMVKSKQMNDENWLLPMMIVLLGFALFIGGMA